MVYLTSKLWFPPVEQSTRDGLLAIGGDLGVDRLLLAYSSGIFPWYNEGEPILWWSPDPRMVLFPKDLKVSKSMRNVLRKSEFKVTFNAAFQDVIKKCAGIERDGKVETWINDEMVLAYTKLFELGHARSVEVWKDGELVGGLYGVDLPKYKIFCGESMFSLVSNASKIGFNYLVEKLKNEAYTIIDCQMRTAHLERLGAREISRLDFLQYLK